MTSRNQGISFASRRSKKDPGNKVETDSEHQALIENYSKINGDCISYTSPMNNVNIV
jgi:hypothetical protein